jgi:hypothetical protein
MVSVQLSAVSLQYKQRDPRGRRPCLDAVLIFSLLFFLVLLIADGERLNAYLTSSCLLACR